MASRVQKTTVSRKARDVRILFVDNHPEFTSTVIEVFLRAHEVVVVPTIAAAKECVQASTFDVLFVDYDLDDGKGEEFLRWLRQLDATMKVVAVSAREQGNEALVAAGANSVCAKTSFANIQTVLHETVGKSELSTSASLHDELLHGLKTPRGLILVCGPTGQGKTTAIEKAVAAPACPSSVVSLGDLRDIEAARRAVAIARSQVAVAVLRIQRAAGAFGRLVDMSIPAAEVAEVTPMAFSTRLFRPANDEVPPEFLLLHERIVVTDAIRALIVGGADEELIHRRAISEGMRSLRRTALEHVRSGTLKADHAVAMTPED